ncbi:cytochrome P450 3A11-like isoform X2 [Parasteatoda tepidariorum]|uniref:cytochrome P450 3A11-like isoform X1 n=1 Tax=Parasteatoda tepidariorum TaxID=114398 RepID=UPI001C7212B0|nr:cytochrome P450 3A11-like isoform X1 [Parasteatoda tepidariorum]XP_042902356.1 cytochrome P450 3A11-like isoform X2 [Parasteatoda tepidariorum]
MLSISHGWLKVSVIMQWTKDVPKDVYIIWTSSFLLGVTLPFIIYWCSSRKHRYWRDRGVKYAEPLSFFESFFMNSQKAIQEVQFERYNQLGRIYGLFDATFAVGQPALTVGDPELLRDIMVKDFHFFPNRRDLGFRDDSVFNRMLILLRDEDWKRVRSIVSPAFSTGKIKRVLSIFKESSRTLLQNLKIAVQRGDYIEIKKLYGAFAMDVIASAAFSTKIDSHNNSENKFVTEARKIIRTSQGRFSGLFQKLPNSIRRYAFKLAFRRFKFFIDTVLQIISERKKTGQTKNDFLQLLLDAATETSKDEEMEESVDMAANYGDDCLQHNIFKTTSSKRISKNELVAQSLVFFLAGYHSTTTTLSLATYLLALNSDVQERAYHEIKDALKETKGELTYESIHKIKIIDDIISETLRLYPPFPTIERIAAADYELGNTGIKIPKGMTIEIPVYSMNRDPENFSDPERFDPDRFSPDQRTEQIPYSYLPFGAGPRNCIGMRFALMELKVCLIHVLSAFKITPKTKDPLKFLNSRNFLTTEDIFVKMEMRQDCPLKE